ncbi:MAG: glucose-6-phosphate dehydrogenase [Gammaproteobacteria bacterium]|nr:glucose-6-phosphate dehydrogenase [Gammaproteobacteria bacterium]
MSDDNTPCSYIIFGATGNLSRIKLMPALYQLDLAGKLHPASRILALGRSDWDHLDCRSKVENWIVERRPEAADAAELARFLARIDYLQGDLKNDGFYRRLAQTLAEGQTYPENAVFYLAIGPDHFGPVIAGLGEAGLFAEQDYWRRLVVEKPFGSDLKSARALQRILGRHLREEQVYRIDHYLGKGTVQNVLVFRFANTMLEPLWNRNYIDHVQITHSEALGIGGRGRFYEGTGALRDMIQSHLLQLLTLVAMEPPVSMEAEALRDEKVKVLKSIRPFADGEIDKHAYRAQYAAGSIAGATVPGYLQEADVDVGSTTETYAALKLYIDNWRWRGVPFYLRTGKRMSQRSSLISIRFRQPPQQFFRGTAVQSQRANWLLLGIQPCDCLRIEITVKEPGLDLTTRQTSLDAGLRGVDEAPIDAYEALLLDAIEGDRSLFLRYDEVDQAWQILEPILHHWREAPGPVASYAAGSWGPEESRRLFDSEEHLWRHSLDPVRK